MRRDSATIDSLSRLLRIGALLVIGLAAIACHAHVAPLVVVIGPVVASRHDIGAWRDDDQVCVTIPSAQALYVVRECLSMRAIRGLILTTRAADEGLQRTRSPFTTGVPQ
jgi:hypothetical protein